MELSREDQLCLMALGASLKLAALAFAHAKIEERSHYEKDLSRAAAEFGKFCDKHKLYEPEIYA